MSAWLPGTPHRTGIVTIRSLLQTICRILAKFNVVIKTFLAPERHIYVDDLMAACEAFLENVPNPNEE